MTLTAGGGGGGGSYNSLEGGINLLPCFILFVCLNKMAIIGLDLCIFTHIYVDAILILMKTFWDLKKMGRFIIY